MKKIFLICCSFFVFLNQTQAKDNIQKHAITAFYGVATDADFSQLPTFDYEVKTGQQFVGATYAYEFFRTQKYKKLSLEAEIGGYEHFGDFGSHHEATATVIFRFNDLFPKNWIVESFAAGEGLSLASEEPNFESYRHSGGDANEILNYLAFELVFKVPNNDNLKFITRIHHRSGILGLFDGIHGASNYWSFGARYKF